MNEEAQAQTKKKRRRLLGCLIIAGIIFIAFIAILLGGAAFATAAIFDKEPLKLPAPAMNNQAFMQAVMKIQKVGMEMNSCPPEDARTLTFDQDEVNAIISLTESAQVFLPLFSNIKIAPEEIKKIKDYKLRFENGKFILYYAKRMDVTTPFGSYINAKVEFLPQINGKSRKMEIYSVQVGAMPIPKSVAETKVDYFLKIAEADSKLEKYLSIVDEFRVDSDNNVFVRYYPGRLNEIKKELMKQ